MIREAVRGGTDSSRAGHGQPRRDLDCLRNLRQGCDAGLQQRGPMGGPTCLLFKPSVLVDLRSMCIVHAPCPQARSSELADTAPRSDLGASRSSALLGSGSAPPAASRIHGIAALAALSQPLHRPRCQSSPGHPLLAFRTCITF